MTEISEVEKKKKKMGRGRKRRIGGEGETWGEEEEELMCKQQHLKELLHKL